MLTCHDYRVIWPASGRLVGLTALRHTHLNGMLLPSGIYSPRHAPLPTEKHKRVLMALAWPPAQARLPLKVNIIHIRDLCI